jgi:hypothetical protein
MWHRCMTLNYMSTPRSRRTQNARPTHVCAPASRAVFIRCPHPAPHPPPSSSPVKPVIPPSGQRKVLRPALSEPPPTKARRGVNIVLLKGERNRGLKRDWKYVLTELDGLSASSEDKESRGINWLIFSWSDLEWLDPHLIRSWLKRWKWI